MLLKRYIVVKINLTLIIYNSCTKYSNAYSNIKKKKKHKIDSIHEIP